MLPLSSTLSTHIYITSGKMENVINVPASDACADERPARGQVGFTQRENTENTESNMHEAATRNGVTTNSNQTKNTKTTQQTNLSSHHFCERLCNDQAETYTSRH